jgi:hypothetical protein
MIIGSSNPTERTHPFRINTLRLNTLPEVVAILKGLDIRLTEGEAAAFPGDLLIDDRNPEAHKTKVVAAEKAPTKKSKK